MKKTIIEVFLVLGTLVAVFLIWELFFAETGIMHSMYNAIATGVNTQWGKLAGNSNKILPLWDTGSYGGVYDDNKDLDSGNMGGFNIDVSSGRGGSSPP